MNISSLPDELLAGIFKYNKYVTLRPIRKMNSRINRIAVKYDIGVRIPVDDLTFYSPLNKEYYEPYYLGHEFLLSSTYSIKFDREIWNYFNLPTNGTYCNVHQKLDDRKLRQERESILKKVQIQRRFKYTIKGTPLNEDYLDSLVKEKRCFRNTKELAFVSAKDDILISRDNLNNFLSKCKKVDSFWCGANNGLDVICNSEVFGRRKWKNLIFHPTVNERVLDGIDRNFLSGIIRNCQQFEILSEKRVTLAFPVTDLIDVVEKCMSETGCLSIEWWRLPVVPLGDTTVKKVHERLLTIQGLAHEFNRFVDDILYCQWKIPSHRYFEITFFIPQADFDNIPDILNQRFIA